MKKLKYSSPLGQVSAVVPVYNEEKTISRVIQALLRSPLINEVIAVNDGSTDSSREILRTFGDQINLIDLPENRGKGYALAKGVRSARGEIVLLLDGDFLNLAERHIAGLLAPMKHRKTQVVLGYVGEEGNLWVLLSGQRVYRKLDLLPHLDNFSGYGVETYLNDAFKNCHTVKVPLVGLQHLPKYFKLDSKRQIITDYLVEGRDIALELYRQRVVWLGGYKKSTARRLQLNLYRVRKLVSQLKDELKVGS